jgi:hypothetical protein
MWLAGPSDRLHSEGLEPGSRVSRKDRASGPRTPADPPQREDPPPGGLGGRPPGPPGGVPPRSSGTYDPLHAATCGHAGALLNTTAYTPVLCFQRVDSECTVFLRHNTLPYTVSALTGCTRKLLILLKTPTLLYI